MPIGQMGERCPNGIRVSAENGRYALYSRRQGSLGHPAHSGDELAKAFPEEVTAEMSKGSRRRNPSFPFLVIQEGLHSHS